MNKIERAVCALCILTGVVLPWGLLISGVVLALISGGSAMLETISAALIVVSLIVFMLIAAGARLLNKHAH